MITVVRGAASRSALAVFGAALCSIACENPQDVCPPQESRLEFFSKGDCRLTSASFFQGHEWLTFFGNRDLPDDDRFTPEELHAIAEGNRRVDWPLELLVHLNNSIVAYARAITEYTDRPENQRMHFLLTDRNDSEEAAAEASALVEELTRQALGDWVENRIRALTLIGQACHTIQDSVSEAHTVREPDNPDHPWCIRKVKAYIPRAPGFDTSDIEYHGGDGRDGTGHTTTEDSIYRPGRECHTPATSEDVEGCLSSTARRAELVTRDYLAVVRQLILDSAEAGDLSVLVDREIGAFAQEHLELCP